MCINVKNPAAVIFGPVHAAHKKLLNLFSLTMHSLNNAFLDDKLKCKHFGSSADSPVAFNSD